MLVCDTEVPVSGRLVAEIVKDTATIIGSPDKLIGATLKLSWEEENLFDHCLSGMMWPMRFALCLKKQLNYSGEVAMSMNFLADGVAATIVHSKT